MKDANGDVVPIVSPIESIAPHSLCVGGCKTRFIDKLTGYVWSTTQLGEVSPAYSAGTAEFFYSGANCTGATYVFSPPAPRVTFVAPDGKTYVLADSAALASVSGLQSALLSGGTCTNTVATLYAVPLASAVTVSVVPAAPGAPPFHVELLP